VDRPATPSKALEKGSVGPAITPSPSAPAVMAIPTGRLMASTVRTSWSRIVNFPGLSFLRPYRNMGEGWKQKVHDLVTIATEGEESDVDS
jgi:hypothetical protein